MFPIVRCPPNLPIVTNGRQRIFGTLIRNNELIGVGGWCGVPIRTEGVNQILRYFPLLVHTFASYLFEATIMVNARRQVRV